MLQSLNSAAKAADSPRTEIHSATAAPHSFEDIKDAGILIADSAPEVVLLASAYLQLDGFQRLYSTHSAAEVLSLAFKFRPDLILLELGDADCSGLGTLRALRGHPELSATPVVMLVGDVVSRTKLEVLRCGATDLLSKPLYDAELLARTRNVLAARVYQNRLNRHSEQLEAAVRERTAALEAARRELAQCLARAAEFRDDDTGHHIMRVGRYARIIGDELGFPPDELDLLEAGAQLHDVGKIGIPDDILRKPGKLTLDESELIQKHCGFGKKIIEGRMSQAPSVREPEGLRVHAELGARLMDIGESPLLGVAKRIALTHHERWDGTGYPVGLAGEDIPLEGRITAVADVFDALSSKRPYKPAFSLERCFRALQEGRGSQFDPAVIDAFFARRDEIIQIQIEYANIE